MRTNSTKFTYMMFGKIEIQGLSPTISKISRMRSLSIDLDGRQFFKLY